MNFFQKSFAVSALTFLTILSGCGGSDDSNTPVNIPVCNNVNDFTVTQDQNFINITVTGNNDPLHYEVSVIPTYAGTSADNGNIVAFEEKQARIDKNQLNMWPGTTYYVYVRSACSDSFKSAWTSAKTFTFQDYCEGPRDLEFTYTGGGYGLTWDAVDDQTSHYQVSYGPVGTAAGAGVLVQTGSNYILPGLSAGTTYDFYVRAYCSGGTGWSSWVGPLTYFSESNLNLCSAPSNITYTKPNSTSANFQWSYNGESSFEYALVGGSQTINNAQIYTGGLGGWPTFTGLSSFGQYTFYVRAVCANGNRTAWTTRTINM